MRGPLHTWLTGAEAPEAGGDAPKERARGTNVAEIWRANWSINSPGEIEHKPTSPVACIALGPLDETGGVIIRSPELGGPGFAYVSARAPLWKRLTLPFTVEPLITSAASLGTFALHVHVHYELPPDTPLRAMLWKAGTLSVTAASPSVSFAACVIGRRRVRVVTSAADPGLNALIRVMPAFYRPTSRLLAPSSVYAQSAVGAGLAVELNAGNGLMYSGTNGTSSPSAPDLVVVQLDRDAGDVSVDYAIQADD